MEYVALQREWLIARQSQHDFKTKSNPMDSYCSFFHCRRYTIERQVFNDKVRMLQPLSINLILFGNENWNFETNIVLFRAVQRYIQVTKRFNNI